MSKLTFNAMLSRGIDNVTANKLIGKKLTITKLKLKKLNELVNLGIPYEIAKNISKEQRPSIPNETVVKLLYESKWTCCVCRDKTRPIVIHHIEEWSKTKDHSENNLVVLCLEHHDLAHTKKELSMNLSPDKLKKIKELWIKDVKQNDTNFIKNLVTDDSRWDYFNHNRIFEIFLKKKLSNSSFRTTAHLNHLGFINELGTFNLDDNKKKAQIYDFGDGYLLYYYMQELFDKVLTTIPLIDLTDKFTKTYINSLIKPGTYIALQAAFYFKELTSINWGKKQTRECYYKKNHIKITFEFDAYETTSNSAWGSHLKGHKVATVIGLVKSITIENNMLIIHISCLALGCYIEQHPNRKTFYNFLDDNYLENEFLME